MSKLVNVETGEIAAVVSDDEYLEALASRVREEYRRLKDASFDLVDAYFSIAQCLLEAHEALPSKQAFGAWFNAQQFGFSQQWAHMLRTAAINEVAVRAAITSQLVNGKTANIEKAVKEVTAGSRVAPKPAKNAKGQNAWTEDSVREFLRRYDAGERETLIPDYGHRDFRGLAKNLSVRYNVSRNGKGTHGRPEQIKQFIRDNATSSLTSDQMAEEFAVSGHYIRLLANRIGVLIHADGVVGIHRSVESNRIVAGIVERVSFDIGEGTAELIDYAALDHDLIDEWVSSLSLSIGSLTTLRNNLKKELTRG